MTFQASGEVREGTDMQGYRPQGLQILSSRQLWGLLGGDVSFSPSGVRV